MPERRARDILRHKAQEAAAELMLRQGPGAVTMEGVARVSGLPPAPLALLFPNAGELRAAATGWLREEVEARVAAACQRDPDPVKALRLGLRAYVNAGLEWPYQYLAAYCLPRSDSEQPPGPSAALSAALEAAMAASALPSGDLDTTSHALWSLIHGVTAALAAVGPEYFPVLDYDHWIESALDLILAGLRRGHLLPSPPPHRAA